MSKLFASEKYYSASGIVKLDYKGRVIEIPFTLSLYGYGGLPLLGVQDKNKHHHTFIRGTNTGWHANGAEPRWPEEFLSLLYDAFETEYIALRAEHLPK